MRLVDTIGWLGPLGLAVALIGAFPMHFASSLALGLGLLVTLTFGIAHGALDHELAERLRGASKLTTVRIVFGYAAVVAIAFTAFSVFPLPLFAAFIVISIVHFGSGELTFAARYLGQDLPRFARLRTLGFGALPIAVPFLAHPLAEVYGVDVDASFARNRVAIQRFALRSLPMTLGALALGVFFAIEIPRTLSFSTAIVGFAFAVTVPHILAVRYMNRTAAA